MTIDLALNRYRWQFAPGCEGQASQRLARELGVHPVIAELLSRRGCGDVEAARGFLSPQLNAMHDPALLPGVPEAADRLLRAAGVGQPIVIYGDYDVDGITASAILWHTLKLVGAAVTTYIPHRIDEGYGLNREAIEMFAAADPRPVVVSVDCGITATGPAEAARRAGLDLIITDHHSLLPGDLPPASILVHPALPGSAYPFDKLCGAGVAFKLAWQIGRVACGSERVSQTFRSLLLDLMSLAALGTVADVVPLVDENRVLTRYGLGQIKRTQFVGLNALIDASGLRSEKIDAFHVGFVLGPRINACGRMGHAGEALHLLTEAGRQEAERIAKHLTAENDRRRRVERRIYEQAAAMVMQAGYDAADQRAIVLAAEGWHQGVIGIVASRLVDTFCRPVVLLTSDQGVAHGSARSVPGVSIHRALTEAAHLMTSFGGHDMAAGMVLPTENIGELRHIIVEYVNSELDEADLVPTLDIDATTPLEALTFDFMEQLDKLAPFGRGNHAPIFSLHGAELDRPAERVGGEGRHLRLNLRQGEARHSAIGFGLGTLAEHLPAGAAVDVAFEPKLSTWNGRRQIEVHIKDLRLARQAG